MVSPAAGIVYSSGGPVKRDPGLFDRAVSKWIEENRGSFQSQSRRSQRRRPLKPREQVENDEFKSQQAWRWDSAEVNSWGGGVWAWCPLVGQKEDHHHSVVKIISRRLDRGLSRWRIQRVTSLIIQEPNSSW